MDTIIDGDGIGLMSRIRDYALPLNDADDLKPLMDYIGDARYVLLGEASHGTHDYYTWRMKITRRLIEEKGFSFIAVEGDWPDCYRVNRYIKGYDGSGKNAREVLQSFNRWPTWMWANWEIAAFTEYLKKHNSGLSPGKKVGFYGLDVYSLFESLDAILDYLGRNDKASIDSALKAINCFEPFNRGEGHEYAEATMLVPHLCQDAVVDLLSRIRSRIARYNSDPENVFSTEQNAFIAVNAEKYYHAMIRGGPHSWNIRDRHMTFTLERLMQFHGSRAKCVVWEHNTHIGDARATDMAGEGMVNVGQLVSEKYSKDGVVMVGFGSNDGTVIAGRKWGDVMRRINMPAAVPGSWENILHKVSVGKNMLLMTGNMESVEPLDAYFGHRAIGVVYNPEYEKRGNYVPTLIPKRYDAFLFIDRTRALHPLHIVPDGSQMPETYPFGF